MSIDETSGCKQKVQGAHRMAVTRTSAKITEMLSTVGEHDLDIFQLQQKQLALSEKRELLKKLYSELLENVPDEELEEEIEQSDAVQEKIELAILELDNVPNLQYRSAENILSVAMKSRHIMGPTLHWRATGKVAEDYHSTNGRAYSGGKMLLHRN